MATITMCALMIYIGFKFSTNFIDRNNESTIIWYLFFIYFLFIQETNCPYHPANIHKSKENQENVEEMSVCNGNYWIKLLFTFNAHDAMHSPQHHHRHHQDREHWSPSLLPLAITTSLRSTPRANVRTQLSTACNEKSF